MLNSLRLTTVILNFWFGGYVFYMIEVDSRLETWYICGKKNSIRTSFIGFDKLLFQLLHWIQLKSLREQQTKRWDKYLNQTTMMMTFCYALVVLIGVDIVWILDACARCSECWNITWIKYIRNGICFTVGGDDAAAATKKF